MKKIYFKIYDNNRVYKGIDFTYYADLTKLVYESIGYTIEII